jgi:hypothetical protein
MADLSEKQEFIKDVIAATQKNPEFRELLLKNPKKILEERLKFSLPEDFEVVVHQDTAAKLNIVLPYASEELTEVELAAVSGGAVCWGEPSCMCT